MLDSVHIMHACVIGQYMHHVHALIMYFADLINFCSFNENLKPIFLSDSVIDLIKWNLLSPITIKNSLLKTIHLP